MFDFAVKCQRPWPVPGLGSAPGGGVGAAGGWLEPSTPAAGPDLGAEAEKMAPKTNLGFRERDHSPILPSRLPFGLQR